METSQGRLEDIVESLRLAGTDLERVEVKAAVAAVPKSLWATVSAFSNHGGGVVILGLDENSGFTPAPGFDPSRIQDGIAEAFRPRQSKEGAGPVTPRPIGTIDIAIVDDAPVLVLDIQELPPEEKPCFVTTQGIEGGSYERVGDGDRRMSTYGVFLLSSDVGQPRDDLTPVTGSTIDDLDPGQVDRFIARLSRTRPRSIADLTSDSDILRRHNVLAADGHTPTLAGLLTLGTYPQHHFPQLMITFAAYPGRTKTDVVGDVRMLDRQIIEGPIPVMVDDAIRAVTANLKLRRISRGAGASDEPEIPIDAIREAVTNALTHRDYSTFSLGDQVRVEVYPDRVEVWNPGGIWGGRRVVDLYDGSSRSRNQALASLLTEIPFPDRDETVSENLGSGIPRMTGTLGKMGLPAPKFVASTTSMTVILDRHGLLSPEITLWLQAIGADTLHPDLQRTLALMHRGHEVEPQLLRAQFGMDSEDAKVILRELVSAGWLRYPSQPGAAYRPSPRLQQAEQNKDSLFLEILSDMPLPRSAVSRDEQILDALRLHEELSMQELATLTGATPAALRFRLRVLVG